MRAGQGSGREAGNQTKIQSQGGEESDPTTACWALTLVPRHWAPSLPSENLQSRQEVDQGRVGPAWAREGRGKGAPGGLAGAQIQPWEGVSGLCPVFQG